MISSDAATEESNENVNMCLHLSRTPVSIYYSTTPIKSPVNIFLHPPDCDAPSEMMISLSTPFRTRKILLVLDEPSRSFIIPSLILILTQI